MPHQLILGRECGACTICCTTPAIDKPEIQKPPNTPCRHCRGGCAIYETRPQICRDYHCGWRLLPILPEDWRPDRSGILAEWAPDVPPQFKAQGGLSLILVGNPLRIVRRPDFMDFVTRSIRSNIFLFLALPGTQGMHGVRLPLNTKEILDAVDRSRAQFRAALEDRLKRLQSLGFGPHVMENSGRDFGA
ncbi:MAG TPA: hypothetical protein VNW15_02190 [Rhizomicrobium sp.]|jgi:hypothetical protein|nr:hypothetical protein [Rhizomicrobium sp.]